MERIHFIASSSEALENNELHNIHFIVISIITPLKLFSYRNGA
jgi:hypothetical protein